MFREWARKTFNTWGTEDHLGKALGIGSAAETAGSSTSLPLPSEGEASVGMTGVLGRHRRVDVGLDLGGINGY
jgi:hypothetical protein